MTVTMGRGVRGRRGNRRIEEERGGGKGGKKRRPDRDEELIDLYIAVVSYLYIYMYIHVLTNGSYWSTV